MTDLNLNPLIGGSRDADVFGNKNKEDHQRRWENAKGIYLSIRAMLDVDVKLWNIDIIAEWTSWEAKRHARHPDLRWNGLNADTLLSISNECLAHFISRKAELVKIIAARNEALQGNHEQSRAVLLSIPQRTAWAHANLRDLWNVGAKLVKTAGTIDATRPTPPVMNMPVTATAPCGNDAELAAHLDTLDADLAEIAKAIKAIRAAIATRAKAST